MQRARDLVSDTNNTTLTVAFVGFALLLLILLPQVIPGGRFGVTCSKLANPILGGNNQSYLAARSEGKLRLEVDLPRNILSVSDELTANVTFVNNGVGAVTFYLVPEQAVLRNAGLGLHFEIRGTFGNLALYSEPAGLRPDVPQPPQFQREVLHVLGPKQRCTEQLRFAPSRLADLQMPAGNYTIQAVYNNGSRGIVAANPNAIATPIFPDQGVYTAQDLRSNTARFSLGTGVAP